MGQDRIGEEIAKALGIKRMGAFNIVGVCGKNTEVQVTIFPDKEVCEKIATIVKKYDLVEKKEK
jgi:hypothetical protein